MESGNSITEFVHSVSEYISLVDNVEDHTQLGFLSECARILSKIYTQAFALPKPDEASELEIEVSREEWQAVMTSIATLMVDKDYYAEVWDPYENDDVSTGSISDDLADIYRDLKQGLLKYNLGTQEGMDAALWDWTYWFQHHYGIHLASVLKPIHFIIRDSFRH